MHSRYASNSSEPGDDRESWSSSSIGGSGFHPPPPPNNHAHMHQHGHQHAPVYSAHFHHGRVSRPPPPPLSPLSPSPPPPLKPGSSADPLASPPLHRHHHCGVAPDSGALATSELAGHHLHTISAAMPSMEACLPPCKTLGIEAYETDNLQLVTNSQGGRGHHHNHHALPPPQSALSLQQQRCTHALADMIAAPPTATALPALIGVFLRPDGTRRGAFSKQLSIYLKTAYRRITRKSRFAHQPADIPATLLPTVCSLLFSYICGLIFGWQLGLTFAITSISFYLVFLCVVLYGGLVRRWKLAQRVSETLLRYARSWRLILDIVFFKPPQPGTLPLNIRLLPVSLKLGTSETACDAVLRLSEKMWKAAASKYSRTSLYLQYASNDTISGKRKHRCRKACCLPAWACLALWLAAALTWATALRMHTDAAAEDRVDGGADKPSSPSPLASSPDDARHRLLGARIALIVSGAVGLFTMLVLLAVMFRPLMRLFRMRNRFQAPRKEKVKLVQNFNERKSGPKGSLLYADGDTLDDDRSMTSTGSLECNHSPRYHCHSHPSQRLTPNVPSQEPLLDTDPRWLEEGGGRENPTAEIEVRLRNQTIATCATLNHLDARSGRQTRFLLSIDATATSITPQRLAELCGLLNRVFTAGPQGEHGVVWHLNELKELTKTEDEEVDEPQIGSKDLTEINPNVLNIFILVMARQDISSQWNEGTPTCDYWQKTLDACHLTVFIDEPTEGPLKVNETNDHESLVESHPSTKSNHCQNSQVMYHVWPMSLAFPDFFVEENPMIDVNIGKLKNLLIHMAFLGRMLKTGKHHSAWASLLEVATTWLSLLVHWPFHTSWLSLFLEEHYVCGQNRPLFKRGSRASAGANSGVAGSSDDEDEATASTTSQPVLPEDTLPMLYSRVLERLAPALSACRSSSSQAQSPASHRAPARRWRSSSGGSGAGRTSAALGLSELAARDCAPARLSAFLRHRGGPRSATGTATAPVASVRQLVAVMTAAPLLDPVARARIQDFLNRRGFSLVRSNSRDLHVHRSLQSLKDKSDLPPNSLQAPKVPPCPVRLKSGLPQKPLSKLTVDDICRLVDDMPDLYSGNCRHRSASISSITTLEGRQSSPQSISRSTSIAAYLLRIRALSISGAVLNVCSLSESLRREIGMTYGDWQLFSSLITHLKHLENGFPQPQIAKHSCQCTRSMADLVSVHRHCSHVQSLHQRESRPHAGTWTSEAMLQRQWQSPSPINVRSCSSSSSGSCTSMNHQWRRHSAHQQTAEEDICRLSGGSCSVYSAELSYSSSSSASDTMPSASTPSISSIRSSNLCGEPAAPPLQPAKIGQRKPTPNAKNCRYDVDV